MAALWNRAGRYILPCGFFFFPHLISAAQPQIGCLLCFYTWCGPSANLECRSEMLHAARWKCRTQKITKNSQSGHHRTTLSGYIFATKARIDIWKKLVKQQYLPQMSLQYGEVRSTSGWDRFVSLGHPSNFNRSRILAALLHGTLVLGVSETLRHWTEGATYIWQGGHHVGHSPTF